MGLKIDVAGMLALERDRRVTPSAVDQQKAVQCSLDEAIQCRTAEFVTGHAGVRT